MARLFGTDGIRGVANGELTCDLAYKTGLAAAAILGRERKRPKVLIGKDTRISGDMIEGALLAGFCAMGADVTCAGVIPTPGVAYLVCHEGFDVGVMISASHNPMQYNGIKFFDANGKKLKHDFERRRSDEIRRKLEREYNLTPATGRKESISTLQKLDYRRGNIKAQTVNVVRFTLENYKFSTFGEFNALLGCFNIAA